MRAQKTKITINKSIKKWSEAVPWDNAGRQSDPNVERTLGHVEPIMGGVMTPLYRMRRVIVQEDQTRELGLPY